MSGEAFRTPYPGYDVLDKWDSPSWDDVTRRVVADRLTNVPPRRFLGEAEYELLREIIDTILPQPERVERERIPVEAFIDEMLQANRSSGTRYADALPMRETWRRALAAIEHEAQRLHGRRFADLGPEQRHALFDRIDAGHVDEANWTGLHPRRFFRHVLLKEAVKIYYAHPHAWSEIGFGGPAAPRGYVRLGPDERDPWEAEERRPPQRIGELP